MTREKSALVIAACLLISTPRDSSAQAMAFDQIVEIVAQVGMGVGMGTQCNLTTSSLRSGFEGLLESKLYTIAQKNRFRVEYQGGTQTAANIKFDKAACAQLSGMWLTQINALTNSMIRLK